MPVPRSNMNRLQAVLWGVHYMPLRPVEQTGSSIFGPPTFRSLLSNSCHPNSLFVGLAL